MNDKKPEKLWNKLGDIPVNNDDEIETKFFIWDKGTDRFNIWKWFDAKYSHGIMGLIEYQKGTFNAIKNKRR